MAVIGGGNKLTETEKCQVINYMKFGGIEWIKGKMQNLLPCYHSV